MFNLAIYEGRLTANPEIRSTESGTEIVRFSVAVQRNRKINGTYPTDFINCVAWGQTAHFIEQHFRKGEVIIVQGEMQSFSYTDKNKNKRSGLELSASLARFPDGNFKQSNENGESQVSFTPIDDYDDFPFEGDY